MIIEADNFQKIEFKIANKELIQTAILDKFSSVNHLVFVNHNNQEANYIAISNSGKIQPNLPQFGFITYDYKNQIEQRLSSKNQNFILFPDKHFFSPELLFVITKNTVTLYAEKTCYLPKNIQKIIQEIKSYQHRQKKLRSIIITPRFTRKEYLNKVTLLKKHIKLGDIYEVNFCQEFYAENVTINPFELYLKLNQKSPTPFSTFVKYHQQYLLCASPERFIKTEGKQIIAQPIKGTIKRGTTTKEDELLKASLFHDPKERAENIMIVDLVRNDLSKIAQKNTVTVDELCGIYTFPQVHQMISTIRAALLPNLDFKDIIHATFPMGSMTGAPKISAMQLIEQYECTKRGLYSGTVGYIDEKGNFDFNVVIRSILYNAENNYLNFFVGGAITDLSDPEKEYEECLLKAKAMLEVLC